MGDQCPELERAVKARGRPSSAAAARGDARPPKPSGVPWLGDIPDDWNVFFLFQLAEQVKNRNSHLAETNLLSLSYGRIKRKDIDSPDGLLPASFDGYNIIEKDDVVLRLTDLQNDQTSLRVGRARERGIITSAYTTIRSRVADNAPYLFYALNAFDLAKGFYGMGAGVRQGLNWSEVKRLELPLPPLSEQRAIAAFLDEKCATIDAIVEEAKAGIAEYAEWKRSIIFHAVTKGIPEDAGQPGGRPSPAAAAHGDATGLGRAAVPGRRAARGDARPPRDSGEKWIGHIPAHWSVLPLKTHADMLTPMRDRPEHLDGPIPWVRIEDFDGKYISASKDGLGVSESTIQEMNLKVYPVGTVLCTSSCDLGKCAIVATPLVSNQRFIGIIPKPGLLADFLYYLMLSNGERLNMLSTGTIQANLSRVEFERLRVQIPPLPEQRAIAAWLDEKCAAIDALVEEKKKLIEDLGAYKKSLIYETVTGKRRVEG